MGIEDIIIIVILVAILLGALIYIGNQKKKGNKCIGCPYGKNCSGNCSEKSEK